MTHQKGLEAALAAADAAYERVPDGPGGETPSVFHPDVFAAAITAYLSTVSGDVGELVERLRERLKLRFISDCKCGECQHVPAALIEENASTLTALAAEVAALREERDEALDRVEELEAEGERVSVEFEGDCWKAMRSLLKECNFDWHDADPDGVTAEDAREHVSTTLDDLEKGEQRWKARAEAAEARAAELEKALARIAAMHGTAGYEDAGPATVTIDGMVQRDDWRTMRGAFASDIARDALATFRAREGD